MIVAVDRKNIQVIDGAENCVYDVFQIDNEGFNLIFPNEGQEIQFIEDVKETDEIEEVFRRLWKGRQDRRNIKGIHGTLFYQRFPQIFSGQV